MVLTLVRFNIQSRLQIKNEVYSIDLPNYANQWSVTMLVIILQKICVYVFA